MEGAHPQTDLGGPAIAITGASGYVGRRLVRAAVERGWTVWAFGRRSGPPGTRHLSYDLRDAVPALPEGLAALFHLAAGAPGELAGEIEVRAAEALLAATPAGARFVFVSSQSAAPDAPSEYGRSKWEIEQRVAAAGGTSVRLGLVYGGPEQGLYGTLASAARRLPVLPMFVWPRPVTQPVHVDDAAQGLLALLGAPAGPGPLMFAPERAVPFDRFLQALARRRGGRGKLLLPLPTGLVAALLFIVERATGRTSGAAQLRALSRTRAIPTRDLEQLGVTQRSLADGLNGRRRLLLDEGRRLMRYVLDEEPARHLVRLYARHVLAAGGGPVLPPGGLGRLDLAVLDRGGDSPLRRRLRLALLLAEASPQGYHRLVASGGGRARGRWWSAGWGLTRAVLREAAARAALPFRRGAARRRLAVS